jgi:endonuclease/exonuclease/phosphatase family metal-dependent hydrolase
VVAAGLWTISGLSLMATCTLIYLRMTTPSHPRAIELVALSPWAVPMAGSALIAALVLVPLSSRYRRKVAFAVTAVALSAALLASSWVAPLFTGTKAEPDGAAALTVMAQNLEYGDPQLIADRAIQARVDLLVVTDARAPTVLQLRASEMAKGLRYSAGVRAWGVEGSAVFSRYPLTDVARISDGGDSRVLTVQSPQLGDVDVVVLHPTPPYQKGGWTADYERITTYLRDQYSVDAAGRNRPVIIAGDLNATLDHAPIRRIRAMGFTDAADQRNVGFQPTWPAPGSVHRFGISVPPLVQIDHVLTSPVLAATSFTTFHSGGTDHMGLLVKVQRVRS